MSVDLVAFLRARLDEDEATARGAAVDSGPEWTFRDHPARSAIIDAAGETVVYDEGRPTDSEAAHIARHDPARVLREVEAKRRILDEHLPERPDLQQYEPQSCAHCTYDHAPAEMHPCPTLRLLGLPYSHHPDYDPGWAPSPVQ